MLMNDLHIGRIIISLIIVVLVSLISQTAYAQLPQYSATLTSSDYQILFTRDIFSDSTIPVVFSSVDSTWTDTQIRFKGTTTRYYPKKSYRIKFSGAHPFGSMRQINFNSMYTDKSFIREQLAWDLFADLNELAPRASHSLLDVNGQNGLYLLIEKVDKYFLQNRGRKMAPMYSANDTYTASDLTIQPDSLLKRYYDKEIGSATDYSDLTQLIKALNDASDSSFADTVYKYFDLQSVLRWFTGNILMMMGDSYNKNYLLYCDTSKPAQRWVVIPWDYDLSFGRTGDSGIPYPGSLLNDDFAYTFYPLDGPANVLKDRFIATSSLMQHLQQYVDTVLQTIYTESHLYPRIDSLAAAVRYAAALDPMKWGTMEEFDEHIEALKYYITARRNYLLKTFIASPSGEYNDVTLSVSQTGVPYHFITYDGRQIATLWFTNVEGLDSIRIRVYPDSVPPYVSEPSDEKFVRRWVKITPYPLEAQFSVKLQWMYSDYSLSSREVGSGVQNERLLKCYLNDNSVWTELQSTVNSFANIVTVDSITQDQCGTGKFFALLLPESYTQKWFRHPSFYWQRWHDIKFVDKQIGFITGEHGTVLKTTDGGTTWQEQYLGIALSMHSIGISSSSNIFIGGDFGSLYRSTDLGISWQKILPGETRTIRGITFPTADKGWIWGERGLLIRLTNSGNLYTFWSADTTKNIIGLAENSSEITIYSPDGTLASTTDQGQTWSKGSTGANHTCTKVEKIGNEYWILGDSGLVIRSSHIGEYIDASIHDPVKLRGVFMLDTANIFVACDGGKIYYTTNQGSEWYSQYTADWHDIHAVTFIDSIHGIAVGSGGTILLTSSPGTVTGIGNSQSNVPTVFQLSQNYPNPFNPVTTIQYALPAQSYVTLKVYDILGREVATVVNAVEPAGERQIQWNASGCSSGVYFYRLNAGTFVDVKKMIVIK